MRPALCLHLAFCTIYAAGCTPPRGTSDGGSDPDTGVAVITTASYLSVPPSGTLGTVSLANRRVSPPLDTTLDADNDVRCVSQRCYVLDRTRGTVRIYDPASGFRDVVEIRAGNASFPAPQANPHDVLPVPGTSRVYVTLYNHAADQAIGILDEAEPSRGVIDFIALPQASGDSDGRPEANNLYLCNGLIWVTLEDLRSGDGTYAPTGPGRLVAIDPGTGSVVTGSTIALQGQNPVAIEAESSSDPSNCERVLIAQAADQFAPVAGQGGIERVDLAERRSLGMVARDTDLGGHPGGLAPAAATLGFVVLNLPDFTAKVVAVNLASGALRGDVAGPTGYIPFARLTPDRRELYIGVASGDPAQNQLGPGLYIGTANGNRISGPPLSLPQGPNAIAFY